MNINLNIPLDSRGQNANIKGHILDEQTMNDHGFNRYGGNVWRLSNMVHPKAQISIGIIIDSQSIIIDIIDEEFLQTYDYAKYGNEIICNNIKSIMKDLTEAGIITGYKENDYI